MRKRENPIRKTTTGKGANYRPTKKLDKKLKRQLIYMLKQLKNMMRLLKVLQM